MATTLVGVVPSGRGAEETFADALVSKYTQRYAVKSASTDTQEAVLATTNLPQMWDAFSGDASARVTRRNAISVDSARTLWHVDVEFSNEARDNDQDQENNDPSDPPEDLSPRLRWSYETVQVPAVRDEVDLTIVANSAGDPFTHPPVFKNMPISVLTWTRWQATFGGGAEQQAWMGTLNNAAWAGAAARTVLIAGIEADLQRIAGRRLWLVTDVLKFRPDGWQLEVPDAGPAFLDGGRRCVSPTTRRTRSPGDS